MDLIPKPDQVVSAVANVAHILFFGGLADLRPMPRTLIDDGMLREVYHYRPAADVEPAGDPVLLVTPLAAPSPCFDLRRDCSLVEHLVGRGGRRTSSSTARSRSRTGLWPRALDRRRAARRDPRGLRARRRPSRAPGRLVARWAVRAAHRRGPVGPADRLAHGAGSPVDVKQVPLVAPLRPLLNLDQGRGLVTRAYRALGGVPKPLVGWAFQLASVQKLVTKPLAIGRTSTTPSSSPSSRPWTASPPG